MVQIIAGTFGYYDGRKIVPITSEDGAQSFDPELEARLVKEGVAQFVTQPPMQDEPEHEPVLPDYHRDMKLEQLKEIAAQHGVDASEMHRKSDVIKAIEQAKSAQMQDEDAEDQPPELSAEMPVG